MSSVPPSANPAVPPSSANPAVPPSANPAVPPYADPKSAVPNDTDMEEKTLEEVPHADAIGPDTDEISEYSEDDHGRNETISHSAGIYLRMRPLLRSRQVKGLFIANSVFIIINILLFLAILAFTVPIGITERNYSKEKAKEVPCYYEWKPWGDCSATCYNEGNGLPMKTREVDPSSVVQARGKYEKTNFCPPDLLGRVDKMPCNVHKCPILLSEIHYNPNKTYPMDPSVPDPENCYSIRDIPLGSDQLILINTVDLIVHPVNCTSPKLGLPARRSSRTEL